MKLIFPQEKTASAIAQAMDKSYGGKHKVTKIVQGWEVVRPELKQTETIQVDEPTFTPTESPTLKKLSPLKQATPTMVTVRVPYFDDSGSYLHVKIGATETWVSKKGLSDIKEVSDDMGKMVEFKISKARAKAKGLVPYIVASSGEQSLNQTTILLTS